MARRASALPYGWRRAALVENRVFQGAKGRQRLGKPTPSVDGQDRFEAVGIPLRAPRYMLRINSRAAITSKNSAKTAKNAAGAVFLGELMHMYLRAEKALKTPIFPIDTPLSNKYYLRVYSVMHKSLTRYITS